MISYIQDKLQKHNKVVFFVLLAVIIVAFVFTIGAAPGLGGDTGTARQEFFGYNLQSERDRQEIVRLGSTSFQIMHGDRQPQANELDNYLIERIAYLGLANELRIPAPTEEQFWRFVASQNAFRDDNGRFSRSKFDLFIDEIEANPQISTGDVALVIEQDFRIQRARELLAGPGYVLPAEVRLQLQRQKTEWSVELAQLDLSGFDPEITVGDEELEQFFADNDFRYERSPRVDFSFALFPRDNFLDQVGELSERDLERHFNENRQRFTPPAPADEETAEGEEPAERPETTLADVRDEVEESLRRQRARRIAGNSAADFAYTLFQQNVRLGDDGFNQILENHRGELRDAPPASRDNFPQELGFPRQIQEWVFRLSEGRRLSDPLELRNNYIVLIYEGTLPSYIPPLDEVRERVARDYRSEERRRLMAQHGEEIRQNLRERIDEGASFAEAAEANELQAKSIESFTLTPPFPEELPQDLLRRLEEFQVGQISPMITIRNTGYFVKVADRNVPEVDATSDEFVQTTQQMRMFSMMSNEQAVIQEFMERKADQGRAR